MLKHRIIPVLLYDGEFCVQTTQFRRPARRLGPMKQYVNNMAKRDVDELVILDITATSEHRTPRFDKIKEYTTDQFSPVSYGGGIFFLDDVKRLIKDCGVDKVIIKSEPLLIEEIAEKFGAQAVIYAMDVFKHHSNGTYFVHTMGKQISPRDWAKTIEHMGAGEILLTHINRQGSYQGYSSNLIQMISDTVKIPVIANGGCGLPIHMVNAIRSGASAVAASSMFALRGITPQDCARALQTAGVPARVAWEPPE